MIKKEEERPLRTTVPQLGSGNYVVSETRMSKNCSSQLFFTGPRLNGETLHEELHITICVICTTFVYYKKKKKSFGRNQPT